MKLHKKLIVIILLSLIAVSLAACSDIDDWSLSLKSKIGQLPLIVSTYDANGQKIDQIKAKSVHIHTDREMSKTDNDGNEKSSVIDVDYGKNRMTHVGSTLIAYEGLTNYEDNIDKGGKIIAHWNFVDHCVDTFDKQFSNDYPTDVTLDGLVQQSNDEDSYTEYQEFDNDSEVFDVISPSGEYLAKKVPENEATRIINRL